MRAVVAAAAAAPSSPLGGLVGADDKLAEHLGHLEFRWEQFVRVRDAIVAAEGSVAQFARGYDRFGAVVQDDGSVKYTEWAPAARSVRLVGDFNAWGAEPGGELDRDEFGVWRGTMQNIPHNSRIKVRLERPDGGTVDRVPAWVRFARAEPGVMGALYDGIHWAPPPSERHVWRNAAPPKPPAPRIYEAHVGMSSPEPRVNTYRAFADDVLPRIVKAGYNTVQLMAVMEHSYYASFGYHVTSPFAVSSRSGTPEDLKYLVDTAHGLGIRVLLDVVHSHVSNNVDDGLNGYDFGQGTEESYFHTGERGYHTAWDSRLYNYSNWEVMRYLLSNLRWWLEEYRLDGFRFDGVTSMLYHHHGLNRAFSGEYGEYFSTDTDVDACVYLMLANELAKELNPEATLIAEEVSGMPTLCRPVSEGGLGFDYRLAMGVPDEWIKLLKHTRDEHWSMHHLVNTLCNRRYTEKTVAYVESHDQALVGDKTVAFWLMDQEMYEGMSLLTAWEMSPVMARGMALHKVIRALTCSIGGEGYMTFMGNEFGHPEWVDFPREGNDWSYHHCRRRYDLADDHDLRYSQLGAFDAALMRLDEEYKFLSDPHQLVSSANEEDKTIVAERGELIFVFNLHTHQEYEGYEVGVGMPGKYRCVLDSDAREFGGAGVVGSDADHFTYPEAPETFVGEYVQEPRMCGMMVRSPARSVQVYAKVRDDELGLFTADDSSDVPDFFASDAARGADSSARSQPADDGRAWMDMRRARFPTPPS